MCAFIIEYTSIRKLLTFSINSSCTQFSISFLTALDLKPMLYVRIYVEKVNKTCKDLVFTLPIGIAE